LDGVVALDGAYVAPPSCNFSGKGVPSRPAVCAAALALAQADALRERLLHQGWTDDTTKGGT